MLDKLRVWTTFVDFLGLRGSRLLAAYKVLSRGVLISSALVPVFASKAPFEYRLSLGAFTLSFLGFQYMFWRDVVHHLMMALTVVMLPLAAFYPFPGISLSFVVLRIPLLLALLSVIAVEIGKLPRINAQGATLPQPFRRSIPSWISECNALKGVQGGPGTMECSERSTVDISLTATSLSSPPSHWDSQTRHWFPHDMAGADPDLLPLEERQTSRSPLMEDE